MKLRLLLTLVFSAFLQTISVASPFSEAADRLDGEWRGNGVSLRVDARRAQASVDSDRPFAWQRFLIKDVTSGEIVFSIGAELFEAHVEADVLTLTGTNFTGTRVLFRSKNDLRGSTSD